MKGLEEFRQLLGGRLPITMLRGVGDPINVRQIGTAAMISAVERLRQSESQLSVAERYRPAAGPRRPSRADGAPRATRGRPLAVIARIS